MKLQINGEPKDFNPPLTLVGLVDQLGMKADRVAIDMDDEHLGRIRPVDRWSEHALPHRPTSGAIDVPAPRGRRRQVAVEGEVAEGLATSSMRVSSARDPTRMGGPQYPVPVLT